MLPTSRACFFLLAAVQARRPWAPASQPIGQQAGFALPEPNSATSGSGSGRAVNGATVLWNKGLSEVGSVSFVDVRGDIGAVYTGSTYAHVRQSSIVDLKTGAVRSKTGLTNGFTFVTSVSKDGSRVAVAGWGDGTADPSDPAPWKGVTADLAVFGKTLDGPPTWTANFTPADIFWEEPSMEMCGDGSVVAIGLLSERPPMPAPVAGALRWFDGATGKALGNYSMATTLGEVFIDKRNCKNVATRGFDGDNGTFTVLDAQTGAVVTQMPDKYNGLAVNADLTLMLTPSAADAAQLYDATSGALVWEYTAAAAEGVMWGLEVATTPDSMRDTGFGDSWAVITWYSSATTTLTFDLFSLPGTERPISDRNAKPTATFMISVPLAPPPPGGPAIKMAAAHDGAALAIAVETLGIFYVDVAQPAPKPVLIWDISKITPAPAPGIHAFNALAIDTVGDDVYVAVDATAGHMVGGGGLTLLHWTGSTEL